VPAVVCPGSDLGPRQASNCVCAGLISSAAR